MARPRLIGTVTNAIRRACDRYRKTRTHGTEGRVPARDGPIAIEWGNDLESLEFKWTDWHGSEQEARVKGRCTRCWGGLVGRDDDRHQITGIKCRVCGEKLEDEAAREEHSRMFNEHGANLENVSAGRLPRYADDAIFVFKTFPAREHMSPGGFPRPRSPLQGHTRHGHQNRPQRLSTGVGRILRSSGHHAHGECRRHHSTPR